MWAEWQYCLSLYLFCLMVLLVTVVLVRLCVCVWHDKMVGKVSLESVANKMSLSTHTNRHNHTKAN